MLTQPAFQRGNPGFAYDYQFVDVPEYMVRPLLPACQDPGSMSLMQTWAVTTCNCCGCIILNSDPRPAAVCMPQLTSNQRRCIRLAVSPLRQSLTVPAPHG